LPECSSKVGARHCTDAGDQEDFMASQSQYMSAPVSSHSLAREGKKPMAFAAPDHGSIRGGRLPFGVDLLIALGFTDEEINELRHCA
jgi:hypothetical protein